MENFIFYPVYYTQEITFGGSTMVAVSYLVHHDTYYKMRQGCLLQNAIFLLWISTVITKCVNFITKYGSCYKMCRLLQNAFVPIQIIFIIEDLE